MNLTAIRPNVQAPIPSLRKMNVRSTGVYSAIIILALIAFEAFNYSTTAYALRDLLGDMRFAGLRWATLMALAFCGLDFAGIARLVTQRNRSESHKDSWFLFGAWLLAAAFNAALTWWGVSLALSGHSLNSALIPNTQKLTTVVPVLVAILVWVVRILIIGTLTSEMERKSQPRRASSSSHRSFVSTSSALSPRPSTTLARPQMAHPSSRSTTSRTTPNPVFKRQSNSAAEITRTNDFINAEQQYH